MLKLSQSLHSQPVISLRTGGAIATAKEPIIDPDKLKILGWRCNGTGVETVLLAEDVRSMSPAGLIVDDEAALSAQNDLVRHQDLLQINFQLLGKPVKNNREKLGKVADYAYDDSMFVQQLYVEPPLLKVFGNHDTRVIGRKQIKEVTDSYILVGDTEVDAAEPATETNESPLPEVA